MAVPVLNDYEWQLDEASKGGVIMNPAVAGVAASLPFIDVTNVSGLDSAEFRLTSSQHEGVDGSWVDSDYMNQRTVVIEGTIFASHSDPETICDNLKANWQPSKTDLPLYFKIPNKAQRVVWGKPQGIRYSIEALRRTGQTAFQATLVCGDTYIYDSAAISFTWNNNTTASWTVGGNHDMWPIVTVTGPITNTGWFVKNVTLNRTLFAGTTLASGHSLVIDMRKRTVLLDGVTNKRGGATGQFWWIDPGVSTSLQFSGTTGGTSATKMTITSPNVWN